MMRKAGLLVAIASALACLAHAAEVDWAKRRAALGHGDKLRVLVDKVLSLSNGWVMTEKHMDEIRDAGFNVISPRIGGDDMARVRRVATMAQQRGMFYMAWMRGSRSTKTGTKLVWADGGVQDLYSPNADELWHWMSGLILGHARLSVEIPSIVGSFLDFENYAKGTKMGNCYALSYDDRILAEFAKAGKIAIPALKPAERHPWLEKHGHLAAFRDFQIQSWRARCRKLRQQIDAVNPSFQLIIYPAPGTLLMTEACYPEWATEKAPLILADACTYGRPGFVLHATGLEVNRRKLAKRMQVPVARGIPHLYAGGIDPCVRGADPEFSGKNAVMISQPTNGYWIFYEGPTYTKPDHAAYFKWFARANREIAAGRFGLWREPREEPDEIASATVVRRTDKPQIALSGMKKRMHQQVAERGTFEVHEFRSPALTYLKQLDVVVLQNFNLSLAPDHPIVRSLRRYVEEGGGLLLAHDTAWFMASPFPEIAVRGYPKNKVEAVRHVVDRELVASKGHKALGSVKPGTRFTTEFTDHMIFKPGPAGTVVVKNAFGEPVYVVGTCGKGRVVFSGCYYGYWKPLSGPEREALFAILDWLKGVPKAAD